MKPNFKVTTNNFSKFSKSITVDNFNELNKIINWHYSGINGLRTTSSIGVWKLKNLKK